MVETLVKPKIIPFSYQVDALNCVENAEKKGKKHALVVMASGLGKTIVAALLFQKRLARDNTLKCLFLCHQNNILEQAQNRFQMVLGDSYKYGFFHGEQKTPDAQILFASFQTMTLNLDKFDPEDFDLVIVDETHHVMAETYKSVFDHFEANFTFGITATPVRGDDKDICELYSDPVYTLSLPDALARGLLCPVEYKLMTDKISSLKEIDTRNGKMSIGRLNRLIFIPRRDEEIAKIIMAEMANLENPRAMIFCTSITHADNMAELIQGAVPIHSDMAQGDKKVRIELFREGAFPAAVTVDMFNEALDVPETNLVVFLRLTGSPTVFYQQLGRGLRPHSSKSKVIILDFVGNCERINFIFDFVNEIREKREMNESDEREWTGNPGMEPFTITVDSGDFNEKIVPLLELINRFSFDFYPTWQEAAEAVKALKIKSYKEYGERYREDPRLPSSPWAMYEDYPGNKMFFAKNWKVTISIATFCFTWQEASDFIMEVSITDKALYQKRYKNYPNRLPEHPEIFYTDYPGDDVFFQKPYLTLQEASAAAITLGIKTTGQYKELHNQDPRLVANPDKVYTDFPGFTVFLGGVKKDPYPTWQEASAAAIKLGIKTFNQYTKEYSQDERLPSNPGVIYSDYPGSDVFLTGVKKEFYPTCQEASAAAIKLGIKDQIGYSESYKVDPKLPSNPDKAYTDFPGYTVFLGGTKKEPYPTWQEASAAAIALGIKTAAQYQESYKQDPKLVRSISSHYTDFPGYTVFLGGTKKEPYPTWQEASAAAIKLGIKSWTEYKKRYSEDECLPSNPNTSYRDFPGFNTFLSVEKKEEPYTTWKEASAAAIALGINGYSDYQKRYKQDPKLPSSPRTKYEDFPGWPNFLSEKKV